MKQEVTITVFKKVFQQLFIAAALLLLTAGLPIRLMAQADSTQKEEAPAVEEESALISPALSFISVQKADNTIDLKAALNAKVKGSAIKLPLLKVTFLLVTDTAEKELGFVITDRVGKAVFNVKADALATDKEGKLHFKAVFAGNKAMEPVNEELTIKRARLEITPVKGDSLLTVQVKLIDVGTGTETPVPEIALGIFVKRTFFPLKIGEGTTDENGEVSVEIPQKLPGDAKGNITLLAKLDENELYGNMEAGVTQPWGTPVSDKFQELPRALWSAHPPLWMMITFIILMCTVWGHYLVIIIQLFRLRKEEPEPDSPNVEHLS
ncbi:MAG: hypothetical protein WAT34_06875 [Chitinophagaceae bacterium]